MAASHSSILICGAGQLGSRYLQGVAACRIPLRIYIQDVSEASLRQAKLRWQEVVGEASRHVLSLHTTVDDLPSKLDIAIVATTADIRPKVVAQISSHAAVQFWVLEKILAQSERGLDEIMLSVKDCLGSWVNTPRRIMPWHQEIERQSGLAKPITLKVTGGPWGLACNAIHYLDLLAWWSGEALVAVNTQGLSSDWSESKRQGNWEITGLLEAKFSGGSVARLSSSTDAPDAPFELSDGALSWSVDEANGVAVRSDGVQVRGRVLYQSAMSAGLVESILETGSCNLPTLQESVALHHVFIGSMLNHWRQAGHSAATVVPIT